MATRTAIIVGSPGTGMSMLVGVAKDTNGFADFLKGDAGGAWFDSELKIFSNPTKHDLSSALQSAQADYSITIFAGHGEHVKGVGGVIWINEKEWFPVDQFRTSARRQLTIVDACRAETRLDFSEEVRRKLAAAHPSGYHQSVRTLYDDKVMAAEEGRSFMWSCGIGQAAGETPDGGYFSQALLSKSVEWFRSRQHASRASQVLDVPSAFQLAREVVQTRHYPQAPVLENGRRMRSFPFAVV